MRKTETENTTVNFNIIVDGPRPMYCKVPIAQFRLRKYLKEGAGQVFRESSRESRQNEIMSDLWNGTLLACRAAFEETANDAADMDKRLLQPNHKDLWTLRLFNRSPRLLIEDCYLAVASAHLDWALIYKSVDQQFDLRFQGLESETVFFQQAPEFDREQQDSMDFSQHITWVENEQSAFHFMWTLSPWLDGTASACRSTNQLPLPPN